MRKFLLVILFFLLISCSFKATYYKPTGTGQPTMDGCVPDKALSNVLLGGVIFRIVVYNNAEIYNGSWWEVHNEHRTVVGRLIIPKGNDVKILPPGFIIEYFSDSKINTVEITSVRKIRDNNGNNQLFGREFNLDEALIGDTFFDYHGLRFLFGGKKHHQEFRFEKILQHFNKNAFTVIPPKLLINGEKVSIPPIEFHLTTERFIRCDL